MHADYAQQRSRCTFSQVGVASHYGQLLCILNFKNEHLICVHSSHGVCVLQNTLVCLFVCLFVDTKTSSLSETGQFMSSTYYVPVRNRKILASTYLTNESVRQGAEKSIFRSLVSL